MQTQVNQCIQVEASIIACALVDTECARELATVPEDAFSTIETRAIHRAIKRNITENVSPDIISVTTILSEEIPNIYEIVTDIAMQTYFVVNFRTYKYQLMEFRTRRNIAQAAKEAIRKISSPQCQIGQVKGALEKALREQDTSDDVITAQQALDRLQDFTEASKSQVCRTGLSKLDGIAGGVKGGKLIILGARPGVGKTALALQIATNVARHKRVLYVSLEMDDVELISRVVARVSGVSCEKFEAGALQVEDWLAIGPAMHEISKYGLVISTKATTPLQVRAIASKMKHEKQGLSMIVIDYIQLMRADGKSKSRYEQVSEISRELKLLAQDLEIPVMAMTQFNRDSEKDNSIPTMAQAKDSGSIEQDANLFLILHEVKSQPDIETNEKQARLFRLCSMQGRAYMQLLIAKNRQGKTGMINLSFNKGQMLFNEVIVEDGSTEM